MSNAEGSFPATAEAPQPRKRRKLTEKRRAQNREAQRLFRERRRKKVFEAIQDSTDPGFWNNEANSSGEPSKTKNPRSPEYDDVFRMHAPTGIEVPKGLTKEQEINVVASQIYNIDVNYVRGKQAGRNISIPSLVNLQWLLNDPSNPAPPLPPIAVDSPCTRTLAAVGSYNQAAREAVSQAPIEVETGESSGAGRSAAHPIEIDETVSDSPPEITEIQRSSLVPSSAEGRRFITSTSTPQSIQRYTLVEIINAGLEALSAKEQQLDTRLSRGHLSRATKVMPDITIEDISTRALEEMLFHTPSPCKTHIDLHEITTFKAVIANAKAIGFWNPIPDDFKDPYKSPFVQSYFMHNQSVEKVHQQYAHVADPLKPLEIQCKTPHKAYIDVFPFPGFRERVIKLATSGQMNELEFCADLGRSAMMCWGSGEGKNGGEPWNPKSWEAQPWFMKKWHMLIDDELRECSRAWSELRSGSVSEEEVVEGERPPEPQEDPGFCPSVVLI